MPTRLWLDGLRRNVTTNGGFATIIAKGEPVAGAVILILRGRDSHVSAWARTNLGDGTVDWRALVENEPEDSKKLEETLEKQRRYDPDLWLIELDIPDPAQFIADLASVS
nr:DUF1491 family protein [Pacificimonas pallii]